MELDPACSMGRERGLPETEFLGGELCSGTCGNDVLGPTERREMYVFIVHILPFFIHGA